MKCEDLKELLESNDEKNARIKANTIECFEQVKDFIVDDLIQKSIKSNFCESGHYIDGVKIYRKLFEIKGIDASGIRSWPLILDWQDEFKFIDPMVYMGLDGGSQKKYQSKEDAIYSVFEYFDRNLFKTLVENHLRSCGFRNAKITNLRGRLIDSDAFYASRSTIEKVCCQPDSKNNVNQGENQHEKLICVIVLLVILLITALFIIF